MQVANLKPYNILDAMKPDQKIGKLEEGNDSLDNFIKQAVAKEPVVPFPRVADSPVQWIQLLQALDYQDLPGWPLLAPPKVEMQKCDKCGREFCSLVNYRRHIRVHRRALKLDKNFPKNRDFLGVFWDKLSLEDAMDIVSLGNISLEDVPGSSIVKGLAALIRKPGFYSLPQAYVSAGSALLDVVQARPSRFPIVSQELFDILDDASEKTFLCAGTALSVQKFVVDGEAAKIVLELKNIVACTCFLLEQKLVNAWLADKDAEALRCQKLLMEEEEAAQKRQTEQLEKRRLKKLRQKEQQKVKEKNDRDEAVYEENFSDSLYVAPSAKISSVTSTESSSPVAACIVSSCALEASLDLKTSIDVDASCSELGAGQLDRVSSNKSNFRNHNYQTKKGNIHWQPTIARQPLSSSHHGGSGGTHSGVVLSKLGPVLKQVRGDQKNISQTNGHRIWTRKIKPATIGGDLEGVVVGEYSDQISPVLLDSRHDFEDQLDQNENREVLIGSIPVTLRECDDHSGSAILTFPVDHFIGDNQFPQNKITREKHAQLEFADAVTNRSVKHWRPVGRHESTSTTGKDGERVRDNIVVMSNKDEECDMLEEICLPSSRPSPPGEGVDQGGLKLFSSKSAEAFLTQRWKEAIAAEHVRLVLSSPERKSANHHDDDLDGGMVVNSNILCENRLSNVGTLVNGAPKNESKIKSGKSGKLKYVPRGKTALNNQVL